MGEAPRVIEPGFAGAAGVARRDITPPVGIYARNWGAAGHDVAEGVHRPLLATALALGGDSGGPLLLLSVDLGWWRTEEDERRMRQALLERSGLDESRLLVALSHTHAGPSICREDLGQPGGELIEPYLEFLERELQDLCAEALAGLRPAVATWGVGSCPLARDRDLSYGGRHLCGFNPEAPADDALVVGRVATPGGAVLATVVNYACHPTTLALDNRLVSPDYVGAMREVVEGATGGAPCLFLQGASGELGPREGYTSSVSVADANGRVLGHSALAVLEGMLPPATALEFAGAVESGASLATWERRAARPDGTAWAALNRVPLERRPEVGGEGWHDLEPRVREERLRRRRRILERISGDTIPTPVWSWRLGDALLVAGPNEAYSLFQRELRRRFHPRPVLVGNLVNGPCLGYLPDENAFDRGADTYQVWQSPFGRGSLEHLIDAAAEALAAGPD